MTPLSPITESPISVIGESAVIEGFFFFLKSNASMVYYEALCIIYFKWYLWNPYIMFDTVAEQWETLSYLTSAFSFFLVIVAFSPTYS